MREYIRKQYIRSVLVFLIRTVVIAAVILLLDTMGLWFFLFSKGQWNPATFTEMLIILLLLEGSLIGAAGAFMFFGYSEARIFGQAAINPIIARDQARRWRERRLSQQKLGITMLITGALLILLFLLVGFSIAL